MLRIIFILLCFIVTIPSFAQPFRYTETIFAEIDTFKNVEYAHADWLNNPLPLVSEYNIHDGESKTGNRPLYMDIYMPKNDTLSKRPVILFAHSGGFLTGSRHNDDMIAFCDSFARRGYITATFDYRLGMGTTLSIFPLKIYLTEENGTRAVYRAVQDSRAAVRFLKHNAETYGIDTTKIYMAGSSAGAFVALHNLYMNEFDEIPELALSEPTLGTLDTVGVQGYGSQVNAVVSMWGAIQSPELIRNKQKPVLLIHGEDDDVVYFKKGMPLKSSIPDFDEISFNVPETYGGFCIDTALNNRNIVHETYFVPGKKHEFYGVDTGEWEENGPNEYWDTVHWKISDFLFEIFRPEAYFEASNIEREVSFSNGSSTKHYAHWDFGDGTFSNEINPFHKFEENGLQTIILTSCNENMACDTFSQTIYLDPLSIDEYYNQKIKVYPNPAINQLNIQGVESSGTVRIIDLLGRTQILRNQFLSNSIDISVLNPGIYILQLKMDNEIVFRKFRKVN